MTRLLLLVLCLLVAPTSAQRKGAWRSKDVPAGWIWKTEGRYEFQSNAPQVVVDRVASHMNSIFRLYQKTFPSPRTPGKPFVVKILKDREAFLAYGAPPSAGAYYSWRDQEMVGYDTGKIGGEMVTTTGKTTPAKGLRARLTMDLLGVFAHEGWHQYFHWYCTSKIEFPSWCDEGIGEYFYTARFDGKKARVGAPNDYRLGTIKAAIKRDKFIPLEQLVTFNQRAYYAQAGLAYAQGWSFVHFLLEHPEYSKKRYLERFVKTFVAQHSIEDAVERVFHKVDWAKWEEDWKRWVIDLKIEDPDAASSPEEPDDGR